MWRINEFGTRLFLPRGVRACVCVHAYARVCVFCACACTHVCVRARVRARTHAYACLHARARHAPRGANRTRHVLYWFLLCMFPSSGKQQNCPPFSLCRGFSRMLFNASYLRLAVKHDLNLSTTQVLSPVQSPHAEKGRQRFSG